MTASPTAHDERLAVPASWWLMGMGLVLSVGWAFFVATPLVATLIATVVAAVMVCAGLRRYGDARVATDPDGFVAGRALLPYRFVWTVEALDAATTHRVLGVDADARAYLLVRSYCQGAVKVTVDDPADPTPYWLICTRSPAALAASLAARVMQD